MKYKILLMGPQGSGKGTQAERLSEKFDIPAFSMGQLLRDEVASESAIGKEIDGIMQAGELVSDDAAARVLKKRLNTPETSGGYILDGYPRNMDQYHAFDFDTPTHVIVLEVPEKVSIERLSGRLTCDVCGKVYNETDGYEVGQSCEECEGELYQRKDDKPAAIKHRLEIYHKQTELVIEKYQEQGLVSRVDATGSIDRVFSNIVDVLK